MKIELEWVGPIKLKPRKTAGYSFAEVVDKLERRPGVYVFARKFGTNYYPIYIGKAQGIVGRLGTQFNNLALMESVKHWNPVDPTDPALKMNGARVLFVGYLVKPKTVGQVESALKVAERALIEHALTEGHEIVNVQMTKTKYDEISSGGVKSSTAFAPRMMLVKAQKKTVKPKA